jgi:hypothetical protein
VVFQIEICKICHGVRGLNVLFAMQPQYLVSDCRLLLLDEQGVDFMF